MTNARSIVAVVVAAGIGSRMQADRPKQYLRLAGKTVLAHTLERLLAQPEISNIVLVLAPNDHYIEDTQILNHPNITRVNGGAERVDSVLAGIKTAASMANWVLVHDAARPCVRQSDISRLITQCLATNCGGILAAPVADTLKQVSADKIEQTVDRSKLWRAFTPQFFPTSQLIAAIELAQKAGANITDEASAIEYSQQTVQIVQGASDNIKITEPADLPLAAFILQTQQEQICE